MFATLELPLKDESRHKRLQGGRACHTCRMKKIKCDGKQPCMQCKARRRKCTFVKAGDEFYIRLDASLDDLDTQMENKEDPLYNTQQPPPLSASPTLPSRTTEWMKQLTDTLAHLTLAPTAPSSAPLASTPHGIGSPWLQFGDFVRWSDEPFATPTSSLMDSQPALPSRAIQERLIQLFYSQCPHLVPLLPRHLFYHQLQINGPFITPFLLHTMYAHAALCDSELAQQSQTFYLCARRLVDDFLDTPRVSTVIGLIFLAFYNQHPSAISTRQWMYTGMASRMVVALGLCCPNYISHEMSLSDVELRRRLVWTAFVTERLAATLLERPPTLTRKMIVSMDWPCSLPEESPAERLAVSALAQLCQLMDILERITHYFAHDHHTPTHCKQSQTSSSQSSAAVSADDHQQSSLRCHITAFLNDIKYWRHRLPPDLSWLGDAQNDQQLLASAHHHHWVTSSLHLVAFDMELSLLMLSQGNDDIPRPSQDARIIYLIAAISHIVAWVLQQSTTSQLRFSSSLITFSSLLSTSALLAYQHPQQTRIGGKEKKKHTPPSRPPASAWPGSPHPLSMHHDATTAYQQDNTISDLLCQCLRDMQRISASMPATDKHRFSQLVDTVVSMHQQPSTASLFSSASTSGHPASTSSSSVADAWMTLNSPPPMPLPTSVPASFSSASTMADVNEAVISATGVMQHDDDMDRRGFLPTPLTYLSSVPASPFVLAMNPSPSTSLAPSLQPAFSTPPPQPLIEPADYTFELISVADEWTRLPMPPS